jgi:hypothetical protein
MASWQRPSSSQAGHRTDRRRAVAALIPCLALLAAGCGRADDRVPADPPAAQPPNAAGATLDAGDALCMPASAGSLRARLQGAIEAEIDWDEGTAQCLGGVRPQGDGVRLLYKGEVQGSGQLLVVLGVAPLRPGESARNVPVNLTVVREGAGEFFATRGQDKCALDTVSQVALEGEPRRYRLEGRGYCTQPARAVGGDGAVLMSRFDVVAIVPQAP